MANKYRIHGITTVKYSDCGADGAIGALGSTLSAIVPDSVVFSTELPEVARILVEGTDDPDILAIIKGGLKTVTFQTRDFDVDTLAVFMGGSVASEVYSAPVNSNTSIFQSIQLTGKYVDGERAVLSIPKALITARVNGGFMNSESGILEVTCEVATPVNGSGVALAPYTLTYETET